MPRYDNVIVKVVKKDMTTNEKVKLCEKSSDFRLVKKVFLIMYMYSILNGKFSRVVSIFATLFIPENFV